MSTAHDFGEIKSSSDEQVSCRMCGATARLTEILGNPSLMFDCNGGLMTESDMGGKRFASRGLVHMLIHDEEMKSYKSAAEVVSGAVDVFAMCGRDIAAKVAEVEKDRSVVSALALQRSMEEAQAEIRADEAWQQEVIKNLPKQDDEDGLTGPLREAFAKSKKARQVLLQQVNETYEKYFNK
ncbi:MAG TPA: hypothetical protein EYM95_22755 [Candidatus Obscuribacterales bacterium]|jgi:hypothetical protein|nr:hypothetical protein [Candidatus Obscuribacterales bacterium]